MAATLRNRSTIHLTDIAAQHAAQANPRPAHVDQRKTLTSGMRAAGSGSILPHEDKANFVPGIAERAKERRRQSRKDSWSPPLKLSTPQRVSRKSTPQVQIRSSEVLHEMSIQPASLSPRPPTVVPETTTSSLKRRASVNNEQTNTSKRARSNSAETILGPDLSRVGYGFTSPTFLASMTENPIPPAPTPDAKKEARRSSKCANPLYTPHLCKSNPGDGLSMLARAKAKAATSPNTHAESIVVKLPIAFPAMFNLHAHPSFDATSDGSATLCDDVEDGSSIGRTPATEVTLAPSLDEALDQVVRSLEIDTTEVYDSGTNGPDDVELKSNVDLFQTTSATGADCNELHESIEVSRAESPGIDVSQPILNSSQPSLQELTPPNSQVDTDQNQHQRPASPPSSTMIISLSPEAAERAKQIVAITPASSPIAVTRAVQGPLNADDQFVADVIAHLERQSKWKTKTVAKDQARRMLDVLRPAKEASESEALFLSCEEARKHLETNVFFPGPIFVDGAQPMELDTVENFLNEYYDDSLKVWIQDPSILVSRGIPHAREVTIRQLKERFAKGNATIPWNCLELAAHVEDGLRPYFLNNEDCRLLTKLKIPSSKDHTSRRGFEAGYKEIEKWALLAQAGSLTSPHQDSHGYSTYITVNQGTVGFGWLSNPTPTQRTQWLQNPATFKDGNWRYKILRPGRTVYFPNGTVHFVFRLHSASDTLAFGGHVLRCSQIVSWVKTLIDERAHRDVTNEDITVSAPGYLERVTRFVKQARRMGQEEKWGGAQAIAEFLRLKDKFMGMK